jgi:spoIIIJ-associated protein
MQSIELTAKSVEEATAQAAEKLGVSADQLTVTVLEQMKGLFGRSNVRVRAEVIGGAAPAAPAAGEAPAAEEKAAKPARGGRGKKKEEAPAAEAAATPVEEEAPVAAAAASEEASEVVATQADADRIITLVNDLLAAGSLEAHVSASGFNGKYVNLQAEGKDVGHLVGKNGEVLNQLQYLINVMITQQFKNGVRITLDGNDYRTRREEQLTAYATKIAEQVVRRGEEAVLDALPAFERRVIHKALQEIKGIKTYSEGEEPARRVVIAPAE